MALAAAATDTPVLRIEREFKAPRERVFAAWTDPTLMAQWWGPEGMTCPVCEVDLRVGGHYRTCMKGEKGDEHWVSGIYREIAPGKRLAFTWAWEENGLRGHDMLVEVEFLPAGPNTRMILTQSNFASQESRDNHGKGWTSSFVCLEQFLSGG